MPRIVIGCWVLALCLTGCARSTATASTPTANSGGGKYVPGDYVETIQSGEQARSYRLHVPGSYQPGKPAALVLNLHGLNESAAVQERLSEMDAKADQAGFVVVYPEGSGNPVNWKIGPGENGVADQEFLLALIRYLQGQLTIDAARIYMTGISNGAEMTERMGCEHADVLAAIAPVSGGYFRGERCNPPRPVPVVTFHGTADNLLPYDGRPPLMLSVKDWAAGWAARNGCGATADTTYQHGDVTGVTWSHCQQNADVTLYTIDGGGHAWPGSNAPPVLGKVTQDINATNAIWDFFSKHPKTIGMYRGPSIAGALIERPNYSGQNVNFARRIPHLTNAGEIYVGEDVYNASEVLDTLPVHTVTPQQAIMKDASGAMRDYKI